MVPRGKMSGVWASIPGAGNGMSIKWVRLMERDSKWEWMIYFILRCLVRSRTCLSRTLLHSLGLNAQKGSS